MASGCGTDPGPLGRLCHRGSCRRRGLGGAFQHQWPGRRADSHHQRMARGDGDHQAPLLGRGHCFPVRLTLVGRGAFQAVWRDQTDTRSGAELRMRGHRLSGSELEPDAGQDTATIAGLRARAARLPPLELKLSSPRPSDKRRACPASRPASTRLGKAEREAQPDQHGLAEEAAGAGTLD